MACPLHIGFAAAQIKVAQALGGGNTSALTGGAKFEAGPTVPQPKVPAVTNVASKGGTPVAGTNAPKAAPQPRPDQGAYDAYADLSGEPHGRENIPQIPATPAELAPKPRADQGAYDAYSKMAPVPHVDSTPFSSRSFQQPMGETGVDRQIGSKDPALEASPADHPYKRFFSGLLGEGATDTMATAPKWLGGGGHTPEELEEAKAYGTRFKGYNLTEFDKLQMAQHDLQPLVSKNHDTQTGIGFNLGLTSTPTHQELLQKLQDPEFQKKITRQQAYINNDPQYYDNANTVGGGVNFVKDNWGKLALGGGGLLALMMLMRNQNQGQQQNPMMGPNGMANQQNPVDKHAPFAYKDPNADFTA